MDKRFFTIEDNQTLIYFQLPKVLMLAERYNKMSNDAKLLYCYYLDLNKKSMKYGWKDDEGRYYIKFKDTNAMAFIGCATEKFSKLKKELLKYDLIHIVKTGQGKTNITYVLKLEYTEDDIYKVNEVFEDVAEDSERTDQEADLRKSKVSTESNDLRKSKDKTFENRKPRSSKIEEQDFRKSKGIIKNDFNENDFSENDFNDNYSSSSNLEDNNNYILEEEDEIEVKRNLQYLALQISESKIMRTNKQVNDTIKLVIKRGLFNFDDKDVAMAIMHYKNECVDRHIGQPPVFFVNGFEMKLDERYSYGLGEQSRQVKIEQQKRSEAIRQQLGSLSKFNWLES